MGIINNIYYLIWKYQKENLNRKYDGFVLNIYMK